MHEQPRRLSLVSSYAAWAAFRLSFIALAAFAFVDEGSAHSRTILLSLASVVVSGGICGAGVWLGLKGKRHAARHKLSEGRARGGIIASIAGVCLWIALAIATVITEW